MKTSRKDETCLQFKMNKHFIKTRKISQKCYNSCTKHRYGGSKRFKKPELTSLMEHTRLRNIAISRRKLDLSVEVKNDKFYWTWKTTIIRTFYNKTGFVQGHTGHTKSYFLTGHTKSHTKSYFLDIFSKKSYFSYLSRCQ